MLKNIKVLVPDYYDQFQCIGSKCEDNCCRGWTITIDKSTYKKYKKINNSEFKEKLNNSIGRNRESTSSYDYGKILLKDNVCPLLSNDSLCEVYINLGEEYMCYTCKHYPCLYNQVNDILEKALTPSCIEAARKILLKETPMEFNFNIEEIENLDIAVLKKINTNTIDNSSERFFNDLRVFCISLIQDRRFSIEERLIILGLFFNNINSNLNDENIIIKSIENYTKYIESGVYNNIHKSFESEIDLDLRLKFLLSTFKELIKNKNFTNKRYLDNLKRIVDSLKLDVGSLEEIKQNFISVTNSFYKPFIEKHEYIYENYLVNFIFSKLFPLGHKSLIDAYLDLMVQFTIIKMTIIGISGYYKEDFKVENIVDMIQGFSISLGHDKSLVNKIQKYLLDNNMNTLPHMIILLGI